MKAFIRGRIGLAVAVLGLVGGVAARSEAGQILSSDFGGGATVQDFTALGLPFLNSGPLVLDGATYTTQSGWFRYGDFNFPTQRAFGQAIGEDLDRGYIDIVFDQEVLRAGVYVGASDAFVDFFDQSGSLLGQVITIVNADGNPVFSGWQADAGLIKRMRITDGETGSGVQVIDRVITEAGLPVSAVPEPSTLAAGLLGVGLMGGAWLRRRGRKAA